MPEGGAWGKPRGTAMAGHGHDPELDPPDSSGSHLALQEMLRGPDTFAAALRHADAMKGMRGRIALLLARAVHFLLHPQVAWNGSVARAVEAAVRAGDERDRWIARLVARLRAAEERIRALETEMRAARAAEEEARRKLALVGIRLRELDEKGGSAGRNGGE